MYTNSNICTSWKGEVVVYIPVYTYHTALPTFKLTSFPLCGSCAWMLQKQPWVISGFNNWFQNQKINSVFTCHSERGTQWVCGWVSTVPLKLPSFSPQMGSWSRSPVVPRAALALEVGLQKAHLCVLASVSWSFGLVASSPSHTPSPQLWSLWCHLGWMVALCTCVNGGISGCTHAQSRASVFLADVLWLWTVL